MSDKKTEYVVSTDLCRLRTFDQKLEWLSNDGQRDTPFNNLFGAEYLYWVDGMRQMNGAVEQATVYDTKDEAEAGAFLAASLDPELAGRVYVMERDKAFERDKAQIAKRKKIMEDEEQFKNMRFKLGKGDGGSP